MPHTGPSTGIEPGSPVQGFNDLRRATTLRAAILLLILATAYCRQLDRSIQRSTNRDVLPLEKRTGWFHGPCFAISNPNLAPGTTVDLVMMGEPQTVLEGQVGGQVSSAASCPPLLEGRRSRNATPETFFYSLNSTRLATTDMGIGVVAPPKKPAVMNGLAQTDLDSDGRREVFSSCATAEGINFAVWTERADQGTPLWSKYYYLGYDLKPTCP